MNKFVFLLSLRRDHIPTCSPCLGQNVTEPGVYSGRYLLCTHQPLDTSHAPLIYWSQVSCLLWWDGQVTLLLEKLIWMVTRGTPLHAKQDYYFFAHLTHLFPGPIMIRLIDVSLLQFPKTIFLFISIHIHSILPIRQTNSKRKYFKALSEINLKQYVSQFNSKVFLSKFVTFVYSTQNNKFKWKKKTITSI